MFIKSTLAGIYSFEAGNTRESEKHTNKGTNTLTENH